MLFVGFAAWQMTSFNYQEFVNDTRNWGLLATPQWIPELVVSMGYGLFVLAILADIFRAGAARGPTAGGPATSWIVLGALAILLAVLVSLGPYPVPVAGSAYDWGSLAIVCAFAVMVWALSGLRMLLAAAAILASVALAFLAVREQGLPAVGLILVLGMVLMLLLGVRIALALGMVGVLGLYFLLPHPQLSVLAERSWNSINTFTLTADSHVRADGWFAAAQRCHHANV